jgi:hypothetical protein
LLLLAVHSSVFSKIGLSLPLSERFVNSLNHAVIIYQSLSVHYGAIGLVEVILCPDADTFWVAYFVMFEKGASGAA